jgi:hypothetical protein
MDALGLLFMADLSCERAAALDKLLIHGLEGLLETLPDDRPTYFMVSPDTAVSL